jgi:hypothetical protein
MPPEFNKYVGKILEHVSDELRADAMNRGLRVNVLDPDFPRNIEVESGRLNVLGDADFKITEITVG